ncbi:hypothetical protein EON64_13720 [archaeon]|nr:MAG: hypothetical protein EON64_13720 [archaeon]
MTDEQLREGKRQLTRHKKTTERAYRRGELRSFLQKMTGTGTGASAEATTGGGGFLASLFAPSKKSECSLTYMCLPCMQCSHSAMYA